MKRGAALLVKDADARQQLVDLAVTTVSDSSRLQQLGQNAMQMALKDSAEVIAREAIRLARKNNK